MRTCFQWLSCKTSAERGFLDLYSAAGSKFSTPAPGVTLDLKKMTDFYS